MQNIGKLMKQAQAMQKKMQDMQEELANTEFEGQAGGGLVKAVITGRGEIRKISIDDELINKDEKDMLEDLIVAAINEAKKKADESANSAMSDATGGLNLPGDFKLPF